MSNPRIKYSDLSTTSKLFGDFIYRPGALTSWLGGDFRDLAEYQRKSDQLTGANYSREELSSILSDQNRQFGAPVESLRNIELLKNHTTLCTITGQQVMLLGGPLLILYKAITTIKLARKLSGTLGCPVVPVFWLATDDHDFDEVNHVRLPSAKSGFEKLVYQPNHPVDGLPMSDIMLDRGISRFLENVKDALVDTEFKDDLMESVSELYSEGAMIYGAFARFLLHLLGKHGLVVINPADKRFRVLAKDVLKREISGFEDVNDILESTNRSLVEAGYSLQVDRDSNNANLFMLDEKRRRIEYRNGRFGVADSSIELSGDELVGMIEESPERFSPNVLLRPIVQSRLFPAIASVCGPAEIAYSAQIGKLFEFFDVVPPVIHPRMSATLIERRQSEFIDKHDFSLPSMLSIDGREAYLTKLLDDRFLSDTAFSLEEQTGEVLSSLDRIRSLIGNDERLARTFEQTRKKIDYELKSFRNKVFKAHRKTHEDFSSRFRKVADAVFPEQMLQERHSGIMYFINRYGPDVIDKVYNDLNIDVDEHQTIVV